MGEENQTNVEPDDPMVSADDAKAVPSPPKNVSPKKKPAAASGKAAPLPKRAGDVGSEFVDKFDSLSEILASIGTDLDTRRMVQRVKAVTCEIVQAQQAVVFVVDHAKKELRAFDADGNEARFSLSRGIAGYVASAGKHMNVTVVSKEEKFDAKVDLYVGDDLSLKVDTLLCVPVYSPSREVCMVITCLNKKAEPYRFLHSDEILMRSVCRQAAVAYRNCVELERTVGAKAHTELLLRACLELCQEVETKTVVHAAAAHMKEFLNCERANLYLVDANGKELVKWSKDTADADAPLKLERIPLKGIAKKVVSDAVAVNIADISKHPQFKTTSKPMSLLCMPVLTPTGKVMAVMQALNLPGLPFTKEHEEYLSHMGAVVGTALHNSNFHRDVVNVQQHISVISSSLELDKILQIITNKTKELLRVKSAVVFLVDADARNLWFQDVMDGQILRRFANMQLYPAGKVALSGQTVCIPECGKDANIHNKELKEHIGITARCLLAMPVKSPDGKIVGVIQAANKEEETGGAFSPEDEVLLRCIASHAGNALYNGQRFAEASASKKHSELFVGYMRALWSKRTIDEIMTTINAQSESLLNCDRCIVYIVDPKNAQSLYAKVTAEEDSREEKRLRNNGRGIVGMVVQSGAESLGGKSVHVADVTQSDAYDKETDQVGQLPPKAILAAPIVRRGTDGAKDVCIGCIELCIVENSKRVFIKEDGDRLELVASVAAVAFENCSLLEHSKEAVASLKHELDRNAGASALYQGIARQVDYESVARTVLKANACQEVLECAHVSMYLADATLDNLFMVAVINDEVVQTRFDRKGIAGRLVKAGGSVNLKIGASDPDFDQEIDQPPDQDTASLVAVAIPNDKGQTIGVLEAINSEKGAFTDDDAHVLASVAAHVGAAISVSRLLRRYTSFHSHLVLLSAELDLNDAIEQIARTCTSIVDAEHCSVFQIDVDRNKLVPRSKGIELESIAFGQGIAGTTAESGRTLLLNDVEVEGSPFDAAVDQPKPIAKTRSVLCVAVHDQSDKTVAVLEVINKKNGALFDSDDENFLSVFAKQAGVMMRNALLFRETTISKQKKSAMTKSLLTLCAELRVAPLLKLFCQHGAVLLGSSDSAHKTTCVVYLVDAKTEGMLLKYNSNGFECKIRKTGLAGRVLTTGEIVNVVAGQDGEGEGEEKGGASNILCGPIFDAARELLGVVHMSNSDERRPFTPSDEELMKEFCDVASVAINNAQTVNPETSSVSDAHDEKEKK